MSTGINIATISPTTPSEVVEFDQLTPTTGGVVFTPNTPATTNILYVSTVDSSTWIYEGGIYITKTYTSSASTPFYLLGTTIDAGNNKTASIEHLGPIKATGFIIGSAYKLPTAAATVGTVLGYVSPGVIGWITPSSGGMIAIYPHDNGTPVYYTNIDTAFTASTPGDMIVVYPGTYATTTTAANGLLKDGISWHFHPNTVVAKSTAGPMFRNNAFTSGTNVYGYGKFTCSSSATNVYIIDGARQNVDNVFECFSAITTTSYDAIATNCTIGSFNGLNITKIKANYVTSATGNGIGFYGYGLIYDIELGTVYTPSNIPIYGTAQEVKGKIKYITLKSGSSHAVYISSYNNRVAFEGTSAIPGGAGYSYYLTGDTYSDISYYSISAPSGMADIIASGDKIMSLTAGQGVNVNSSILWNKVVLAGSTTGLNNGVVTGSAVYLILSGGLFSGEVTGKLDQTGGKFEGVVRYSGRGDFSGAAISGGVCILREFGSTFNKLAVSGTGDVTLYNYYTGGNNDPVYNGSIDLSAGTLRVMGIVKNNSTTNTGTGSFPCVNWTGGTLILHSSAAFYCGSSDSAAIKATGSMTGKIYGKVVSNTADTGTITWQVGTGADRVVDTNVR